MIVVGLIALAAAVLVCIPPWRQGNHAALKKYVLWIVFSVIVALAPFGARAVSAYIHGSFPTLPGIIGHGELFFTCAAIGTAAIGRMIGTGPRNLYLKIIAGGAAALLVFVSCVLAGDTAQSASSVDPQRVGSMSYFLFCFMLPTGAGCVLVSEEGT
jgi:peptidoglycan/LPS O-acetylase OafA/YrhL